MRIVTGTKYSANTGSTKGWAMGHMFPCGHLGYSTEFEVKLWQYDSQPDYPPKRFNGVEFIAIFAGRIKLLCEKDGDKREVVLVGGNRVDYCILEPGITKTVVLFEGEPAWGVTVRSPSDPGVNKVFSGGK